MEYQLRITKIAPGRMDDFVRAWTANVARIRRRRGFTIEGAWVIEDRNEFVWILGYDGDDGFEAADRSYHESEERLAISNDPAEWILDGKHFTARKIV